MVPGPPKTPRRRSNGALNENMNGWRPCLTPVMRLDKAILDHPTIEVMRLAWPSPRIIANEELAYLSWADLGLMLWRPVHTSKHLTLMVNR